MKFAFSQGSHLVVKLAAKWEALLAWHPIEGDNDDTETGVLSLNGLISSIVSMGVGTGFA